MEKITAQVRTCTVNRVREKFAVDMLLNFGKILSFGLKTDLLSAH